MNRLPSGYRMIESLDFVRNRKQMMIVFALSIAIIAVMLAIGLIAKPIAVSWRFMIKHLWTFPVFLAMQIAYIPLHEMVHGVFMRLFSRKKVRYGFSALLCVRGKRRVFHAASAQSDRARTADRLGYCSRRIGTRAAGRMVLDAVRRSDCECLRLGGGSVLRN